MRFLGYVVLSLILGLLVGRGYRLNFGNLYELVLYILIFIVGIELGQRFETGRIKEFGSLAITLPFITLSGSLLGGVVASALLGVGMKWGLAVAAGCGWYSLTGPLIGQYSVIYGTLGFLANLVREMLTILMYPLAIKGLPKGPAVSIGGATTMDTTLAVMTKYGGSDVTLVAFVHGFILTLLIPFVVPLILQL